jgi:molybdopterin-guanine dinucleotide biosynthesis protein A
MGTDKALVRLGGEPLISRALDTLRESGLDPAIAGARSSLSTYGRVIEDAGRGPLGGICAALESLRSDYAVFLSVDTPLLPSNLIRLLLVTALQTEAGITITSVNGFAQTFPVVVHRSLLPALQSQLETGKGGCYSALRAAADQAGRPLRIVAVEHLVQAGQIEHPDAVPAACWFLNVNTPADLAQAESLLALRHRVS